MSGPARDAILARIRAATQDVPADEQPRWEGPATYHRGLDLDRGAIVDLFCARVADYRARVIRCAADDGAIARALASAAAEERGDSLLAPHDLSPGWLPARDLHVLRDDPGDPLDLNTLDGADGVVTAAALAIAETGTIVLDAGAGQGRRALTLVPDLHLCVVRTGDIVGTVPEAFDRLAAAPREGRPVTFVSGPSATSDIELERVEGVHGPRRLVVVVAG